MIAAQLKELLLQSLTCERGGVQVYQAALTAARNTDLKEEWQHYLEQTTRHVQILTEVIRQFGWDPNEMTPGCKIVHHNGKALVVAIEMALAEGDPAAAELVATESVLLAETKDHADWELLSQCAQNLEGPPAEALQAAVDEVEEEEDRHLYHTQGWSRELWLKSLGLDAHLPPPEEEEDVTSAAEAEEAREHR